MKNNVSYEAVAHVFGFCVQTKVLVHMMNLDGIDYISGIARATGISHSSVARVAEPLVQQGILIEEALGKQIRTFRLNKSNLWVHNLRNLLLEIPK